MNLMRGIDLKKIAEKMGGASGAELKVLFFLLIFLTFAYVESDLYMMLLTSHHMYAIVLAS